MTGDRKRQTLLNGVHFIKNAGEGLYIAAGVGALIAGILVDVFVVRLLCLLVITGSGLLLFATMRAKQLKIHPAPTGTRFHSPSQTTTMKKLIFDDYQLHTEDEPAHDRQAPATPAIRQTVSVPTAPARRPVSLEVSQPELTIADFFDIDSDIYKGDSEPRTEFDFLLNKVLSVIKEVLFAHSVAFFWANREKQQMVMEARVTESDLFFTSRRFPMGHDLVSKVALTGRAEFITDVNPMSETEMFRYYDRPASVKSFVGVPVFFSKGVDDPAAEHPVAVIAVDSKAVDDFGPETLVLMGRFTKLVSAIIKSYNDKYDLILDSELLSSIRRLHDRVRGDFSLNTIVQALSEEGSKLINFDFLALVLYDESKRAWITQKVINRAQEGYVVPGQVIDFPDSVVGGAIRTNTHCVIDDLETVASVRYHLGEKPGTRGSLISIPISSLNKCYGALTLESREKFNFSRRDVEIAYRLAENTASALEIYYLQEVISEYVIVDGQTGMYSKKFFMQKLEEELERADDAGTDLSMLFMTVDKSSDIVQRFGNEGYERVMLTLAKAIRASVRSYDLVGRYDAHKVATLLVNTAANDAYLWAEKIRKNLAGLVINLDGKTFSITISVGVCGALEGMRKEEFLTNAITVLTRASEAGGNVVRVF